MRVPSVRVGAVVATVTAGCSFAALSAVDAGVVPLPAPARDTLVRAVPIFLTATAITCAFNGVPFRTNWLLILGPPLAYATYTFLPAFGPAVGLAVGVASGAVVAGLVAGAGHATGRGYRELIGTVDADAENGEHGDFRR